jgi:exopolysaccharide biosynthesis WecB/TagA/CpsF family protein
MAIDHGRHDVLGVLVNAVDYDAAAAAILAAARDGRPFAASAVASHAVMTGVHDPAQRHRLNALDLLVPDGQPVRWALNLLHDTRLADRVYGPELTLRLCAAAAREGLPVYFYGSTPETLERLTTNLTARGPGLVVAGARPSRFRPLTPAEKAEVVAGVRASGARLLFVGLGCPRQEVWAYEYRPHLALPIVAVGAAFDFHAGVQPQAPAAMQRHGFEWLFRLVHEPRRLWRRYLQLGPAYLALVGMQKLGVRRVASTTPPPAGELGYG